MRVYLDSNVYSYVTEQREHRLAHELFLARAATVLASDTIILEAGRIPDREKRLARMAAVRVIADRRIEPFPYRQAMEVVSEVRRCRPEWLRSHPSLESIERFLKAGHRLWKLLRNDRLFDPSAGISAYLSETSSSIAAYLQRQREARQLRLAGNLACHASEPDLEVFLDPLSQSERYWRLNSAGLWAEALEGARSVRDLKDYLGPYLLPIRDATEWKLFWYRDVQANAMPLCRIHHSTEFHQPTTKISHGDVRDAHHAVYLSDCDFFLTCDKDLQTVLQLVVAELSPSIPLGTPVLVDRQSSRSAVLAITHALEETGAA